MEFFVLHIDLPSRTEIEKLADYKESPAVSIYLRTTPNTQDAQADRIELKNLLKSATSEMAEAGASKRSIEAIQLEVEALIEDDEFWAIRAIAWQSSPIPRASGPFGSQTT